MIVTVHAENQGFFIDVELPAQLPVSELMPKLLDTLKEVDAEKFSRFERLSLIHNGVVLLESAMLESEAVWDGKILVVR